MSRIGQPLITPGNLVTLNGTQTLTNKTLTSPTISGAGGTVAGQQGYDSTNKAITVGDGAANQSLFTSAWKAYTPSLTNVTLNSGSISGRYCQVGKLITATVVFTMGADTSISGNITFSLPVQSVASPANNILIGQCYAEDNGIAGYMGFVRQSSSTNNVLCLYSGALFNGTAPFTWANGDFFKCSFTYEAV